MKKTVITTLLALVVMTGQAQEIRANEPTLDDYMQLLKAKGYIAYSFNGDYHVNASVMRQAIFDMLYLCTQ